MIDITPKPESPDVEQAEEVHGDAPRDGTLNPNSETSTPTPKP